jgi:hypothetical protein
VSDDIVLWVIGQLFVGVALYGGIRVDIKNIHEKINNTANRVSEVNERVDKILLKGD